MAQDEKKTPAKKSRKTRSRKSTNSLSKITLKGMVKAAKSPLLVIGGFYLGRKIITVINEQTQLVEGIFGEDGKKFIAPGVTALLGLGLSQITQDKNVKMFGYGVAVAAGVELTQTIFDFDILAGLGETTDPVELPAAAEPLNLKSLQDKFNEIENEIEDAEVVEEIENEEPDYSDDYEEDELPIA